MAQAPLALPGAGLSALLLHRVHRADSRSGALITNRLRQAAGIAARDLGHTVNQAAHEHHLAGPTVVRALRQAAAPLAEAEPAPVAVLDIDETRCGRLKWAKTPDGTWTTGRDAGTWASRT